MNGQTDEPSIAEANKMVRVLKGERLKYTVRLHRQSGEIIEYQSNKEPKIVYNDEARALWICSGDYGTTPITSHESGMVILSEENPK